MQNVIVLTESFAAIHEDHRLGEWVRNRTKDPEARYELFAVADLGRLNNKDLALLARDIAEAAGENGRLLIYGRGAGIDYAIDGVCRRLPSEARSRLRVEPYELGLAGPMPRNGLSRSSIVLLTASDRRLHGARGGIVGLVLANLSATREVAAVDVLTTRGSIEDLVRPTARLEHAHRQLAAYADILPTVFLAFPHDARNASFHQDMRSAAWTVPPCGFEMIPAVVSIAGDTASDLATL